MQRHLKLFLGASALVVVGCGQAPSAPEPQAESAAQPSAAAQNGLFKAEVIWRKGPWRWLEGVEYATLEWVDWYTTKRLLEPIGYVAPAEAEAAYNAAFEEPAIAA